MNLLCRAFIIFNLPKAPGQCKKKAGPFAGRQTKWKKQRFRLDRRLGPKICSDFYRCIRAGTSIKRRGGIATDRRAAPRRAGRPWRMDCRPQGDVDHRPGGAHRGPARQPGGAPQSSKFHVACSAGQLHTLIHTLCHTRMHPGMPRIHEISLETRGHTPKIGV